jgi:hypothetical protein
MRLAKAVYFGGDHYTPPARGEKVGMRGRFRESELVEAPPHRAEF